MNECPHGDDPQLCPPCQKPPRGKRLRDDRVGSVTTARYPGDCPGCPFGIDPGQDVRVYRGRWWHVRCAEAAR